MNYNGRSCIVCICCFFYQIFGLSESSMDKWNEGNETKKQKYAMVDKILSRYTRPFTMLDVCPDNGYYALQVADRFRDSVCVMIDTSYVGNSLLEGNLYHRCMVSALPNIILLGEDKNYSHLKRLSECEHFDLIIAFTLFEHVDQYWQSIAENVCQLGDNLFVEVPKKNNEIMTYFKDRHAQVEAEFEKSIVYFFATEKTRLKRKHWMKPLTESSNADFSIKSTYHEKKLLKNYANQQIDWIPGINLLTFKMHSGIFPTIVVIKTEIEKQKKTLHTDWNVHNMILAGNAIKMIDVADQRYPDRINFYDQERETRYQHIMRWLDLNKIEDVQIFYIHKLYGGDRHALTQQVNS